MTHKIYALTDSRSGAVKYIGATKRALRLRLDAHMRRAHQEGPTTPKNRWLLELAAQGLVPGITELESVEPDDNWEHREQWWIAVWADEPDLLNQTAGGVGQQGMAQATRRKISASLRGQQVGNQHAKGNTPTAAHKAKLSRLFLGKPRDPEVTARISEGLRRYHASRRAA